MFERIERAVGVGAAFHVEAHKRVVFFCAFEHGANDFHAQLIRHILPKRGQFHRDIGVEFALVDFVENFEILPPCFPRFSFGAGLLEAVSQVLAEQRAVLLVCSDTAGSGPLREVTGCEQAFGCALVLAPAAGPSSIAVLDLQLLDRHADTALPEPLAGWRRGNPSATSLALLAQLSQGSGRCRLAASPTLGMQIDVERIDKEGVR